MSDRRNERCEHCKFYEPEDANSGICRNPDISQNQQSYKPTKEWPKVRSNLVCGFFIHKHG